MKVFSSNLVALDLLLASLVHLHVPSISSIGMSSATFETQSFCPGVWYTAGMSLQTFMSSTSVHLSLSSLLISIVRLLSIITFSFARIGLTSLSSCVDVTQNGLKFLISFILSVCLSVCLSLMTNVDPSLNNST